MSETKKRKEIKSESYTTNNTNNIKDNAADEELKTLNEELFADIVSVESIKNSRKGREPKYSKLFFLFQRSSLQSALA